MTRYGRAITVDGAQAVMVAGVIDWDHDVYRHIVVLQYPNGAATVVRLDTLADADLPDEVITRYDGPDQRANRAQAVAETLRITGYHEAAANI